MKFLNWLSLVLAVGLVVGCGGIKSERLPERGRIELSEVFTGKYRLIDMHGQQSTNERFVGKPTLIYFGFTSCPDVCPASLGIMSAALNALGNKADRLNVLFIALDPERDTPAALTDYLAFDSRILGLTGTPEQIDGAKDGFKVYSERQDLPGSALGYTIDHSSFFYFVDAAGKPQYAFIDSLTPQQLADFLRPLL